MHQSHSSLWLQLQKRFNQAPSQPPKQFIISEGEIGMYNTWCQALLSQCDTADINESQGSNVIDRLWSYILPLMWKMQEQLLQKHEGKLIVGLNGMQGSGKSTLGTIMQPLFSSMGVTFESVSLDDYYLPYAARQQLDKAIYKYRGPPGTHSVLEMLEFVQQFKKGEKNLKVPTFAKHLHDGQGDRTGYRSISDDTSILLVEGWMLGYRQVDEQKIVQLVEGKTLELPGNPQPLTSLNSALHFNSLLADYHPIWDCFDLTVVLQPLSYNFSLNWRQQAEQKLRETTGAGMSDQQVKEFVTWYWQALHPAIYVPSINLTKQFPSIKADIKLIQDADRKVVDCIINCNEQC